MVVYLSRFHFPPPGKQTLVAQCGNCSKFFSWNNPFWNEKKHLPKKEQCECGAWNVFVTRLNTIYDPQNWSNQYGKPS